MKERTAQTFLLVITIGVIASLVALLCVVFDALTIASILIISVVALTMTFIFLTALYGVF